MIKNPLVSVSVVTYNHEPFIKRCLESILMQKTKFPYEIIIGEDCSTDDTRNIVLKYQEQYPEIIKVITSTENVGMRMNGKRVMENCRRKYIASCDGDDYWTDPLKLQKQVDFMVVNSQYSMCFHNAMIIWGHISLPAELFCSSSMKNILSTEDLIENWSVIPTSSRMFRSECIKNLPEWTYDYEAGDRIIFMFCSLKGDIGYINETMSVYRKHPGGWTLRTRNSWREHYNQFINFYEHFNKLTNNKYKKSVNSFLNGLPKSRFDYTIKQLFKIPYRLIHMDDTIKRLREKFYLKFYSN